MPVTLEQVCVSKLRWAYLESSRREVLSYLFVDLMDMLFLVFLMGLVILH